MRLTSLLEVFVAGLLMEACGTTSHQIADDMLVASEPPVLSGRYPVLFVGRAKEDGQWIFLTDERSLGGPVIFAAFGDVVAMDSTLNQLRDLPIGWKAMRETKAGPWRREPIMGSGLAAGNPKKSKPFREPTFRPSSHYQLMISEPRSKSRASRRLQVFDNMLELWQDEESPEGVAQTLVWRDSLRRGARDSLDSLAAGCGLDTLKENYAASEGSPATRLVFVIGHSKMEHAAVTRLNDCWVPSLYRLTAFVNTLLPQRYVFRLDMALKQGLHEQ